MKNILKITALLLLSLSFTSCKKDNFTPVAAEESFDIRQYVLIIKETRSNGWIDNIRLRTFEAQGKCVIFTEIGAIPDKGYTYSYDKGILKLFYGGRPDNELKVENNTIKSTTDDVASRSYKLIKIPSDNPFNGNIYSGGWKSEGSLLTVVASLKFTDTHFSEASINLPVPDKTYELIKNIAAYKRDVTNDVFTLWVLSEGNLEGYRTDYGNNNNSNRVRGTFTKQ